MENNLNTWLIDEIIEKLEECKGYPKKENMYDLAFDLFQSENVDGSYYCSRYQANEWIKENFDDLGDIIDEYEFCYGDSPANPFSEPEKFQVQIVIFQAQTILQSLESDYEDDFLLDDETIDSLIKALREYEAWNISTL